MGDPVNPKRSASDWRPQIQDILADLWPSLAAGPRWVEAQVERESAGDPHARSPVGAVGLLQLMPGTGMEMGLVVEDEVDERLDPIKNLRAGVGYLKKQFDRLSWFPLVGPVIDEQRLYWAFASYNGGYGYARRALQLARGRELPYWWRWGVSGMLLGDPACIVNGRHPDHKQITGYVVGIQRTFDRLGGRG